jgi:hypothetical protein
MIDNRYVEIERASSEIMTLLCNVENSNPKKRAAAQKLVKLLYFIEKDKYEDPRLLPDVDLAFVRENILHDRIKHVPILPREGEDKCFVVVLFDNFEFSNDYVSNVLTVDIAVPTSSWLIGSPHGVVSRQWGIMAAIKDLLDGASIQDLGILQLQNSVSLVFTADLIGHSMIFGMLDFN